MELEITTVKENPLMKRREVKANVKHEKEATPSKDDVLSRITADKGLEKDNVEIKHIYTNYGDNSSLALIQVYEEFDYDESLEAETIETEPVEETEASETSEDYEEVVNGTITDAKEALNDMEDADLEAALQAEKNGKNRTTLVDWLEDQL